MRILVHKDGARGLVQNIGGPRLGIKSIGGQGKENKRERRGNKTGSNSHRKGSCQLVTA